MRLLKKKLSKTLLTGSEPDETLPVKIEVKIEPHTEIFPQAQNKTSKPSVSRNKRSIADSDSPKTQASSTENSLSNAEKRKKSVNSSKNIVKNFARAMITFTLSDLAYPYLESMVAKKNVNMKAYKEYFKLRKENMDGISSLRALLLVEDDDEEQEAEFKRIFQYSCEIFLKYFSVNWVYDSKVGDKSAHVKARFKLLRRIQNPQYFTYLKF